MKTNIPFLLVMCRICMVFGLLQGALTSIITFTSSGFLVASTLSSKMHIQRNPVILISPNGNEEYYISDTISVTWSSSELTQFNNCIIAISLDNGKEWYTITSDKSITHTQPQWGGYQWIIPEKIWLNKEFLLCNSSTCIIKVSQYANAGICDISDMPFSIHRKIPIKNTNKTFQQNPPLELLYTNRQPMLLMNKNGKYTFQLYCSNGIRLNELICNGPLVLPFRKLPLSSGFYFLLVTFENTTSQIIQHKTLQYLP